MATDLEIAQRAPMQPIEDVAARLGIPPNVLELHGRYKAKLSLDYLRDLSNRPDGKLILVSAMSPTPPGEGKTTTTIGLGDALNRLGHRTVICLREPSMGPVFGMKGGATGGGHAQIMPMEDINLHFTGDFAAIERAHNLLAALIDNHLHQGNALNIDPASIRWRRVMDMNDRALREITVAQGGKSNGTPRSSGFDIVVASEVMAILCLASDLSDLKARLERIIVAETHAGAPVTARELKACGAMTLLLRDAFKPNLVQTLEHNPAILHGGPFANIAHGCNSLLATRAGLKLGKYVVTEAGFGADLGAEKFVDIKCRLGGLSPAAAVVVATIRAVKYHGGAPLANIAEENLAAVERGVANLRRHVENVRDRYGLPCVVAVNRFASDTPRELESLARAVRELGVDAVSAEHFARGGAGAEDLARAVVEIADKNTQRCRFVYEDGLSLWEKVQRVAQDVYGAADVAADPAVREQVDAYERAGFGRLPVCIAKTQYSFSTDPKALGAPVGHTIRVREVRLAAGAGFVVFICGSLVTMPGLPKKPAAESIDVDAQGRAVGLF
jgi:formate--tetrahydrofolate ligase